MSDKETVAALQRNLAQSERYLRGAEQLVARYASALVSIACLGDGPVVHGGFDEPGSARLAREALAAEWIGPCVHGRDPWTRCEEGCEDEVEAWAAATIKARGGA
jgi:hypothetical protein